MKTMLTIAALLFAAAAQAQTIHKCTHEGKVTYSEAPCERGTGSVLAVPGAPAPDPQSRTALRAQQKEAKLLEKERKAREAQQDREDARQDKAAANKRRRCDKLRLDQKWANDDVRRASPQGMDAARLKARRTSERMALECG
jgi:hypothetical protein